jgi:hypothetical protein
VQHYRLHVGRVSKYSGTWTPAFAGEAEWGAGEAEWVRGSGVGWSRPLPSWERASELSDPGLDPGSLGKWGEGFGPIRKCHPLSLRGERPSSRPHENKLSPPPRTTRILQAIPAHPRAQLEAFVVAERGCGSLPAPDAPGSRGGAWWTVGTTTGHPTSGFRYDALRPGRRSRRRRLPSLRVELAARRTEAPPRFRSKAAAGARTVPQNADCPPGTCPGARHPSVSHKRPWSAARRDGDARRRR